MHKPKTALTKCSNQWHAETLQNVYRHENVETSDAQMQTKIGTDSFVHMEENTTTITKQQDEIITKIQEMDTTLMRSVPRRRMKVKGKEMENNIVVTHQ